MDTEKQFAFQWEITAPLHSKQIARDKEKGFPGRIPWRGLCCLTWCVHGVKDPGQTAIIFVLATPKQVHYQLSILVQPELTSRDLFRWFLVDIW